MTNAPSTILVPGGAGTVGSRLAVKLAKLGLDVRTAAPKGADTEFDWNDATTHPVGAENLCHQAIFVDDATRAVMPPDPEMIQVGDAIWQRPQWCGLVQGAVRPVGVVEVLVLPQHHHQVALVPDQGPVQQLTPAAANPPLRDRIHSRCLNGGADDPDPGRLEHGIQRGSEPGGPVMQA